MLKQLFINLIIFTLLPGCVSVKLAGTKSEKAKGCEFSAPSKPFKAYDSSSADIAWMSVTTGNTIAVLSDCAGSSDLQLTSLETEALAAISDMKVLSRKERIYNSRSSLFTEAEGLVDGVSVHMSLVTFQKNGCDFSLSYFGRKQNKGPELSNFETFVEGFKAP